MVFHRSLRNSKFPQVSRILLVDLNNAVVWMVSTHSLISKYSSSCTYPLVTLPKAPITIGINLTFISLSFFFNSLWRSRYLSLFSHSFNISVVCRDSKVHNSASSLFLLIITRSGHLAESSWSVCMLKSQMNLCVSFSRQILAYVYTICS